jgi:hypothetical protein
VTFLIVIKLNESETKKELSVMLEIKNGFLIPGKLKKN